MDRVVVLRAERGELVVVMHSAHGARTEMVHVDEAEVPAPRDAAAMIVAERDPLSRRLRHRAQLEATVRRDRADEAAGTLRAEQLGDGLRDRVHLGRAGLSGAVEGAPTHVGRGAVLSVAFGGPTHVGRGAALCDVEGAPTHVGRSAAVSFTFARRACPGRTSGPADSFVVRLQVGCPVKLGDALVHAAEPNDLRIACRSLTH
jgi:hypothetical protein